jgi:hypothetical protein
MYWAVIYFVLVSCCTVWASPIVFDDSPEMQYQDSFGLNSISMKNEPHFNICDPKHSISSNFVYAEKREIPDSFPKGSLNGGLPDCKAKSKCAKRSKYGRVVLEFLMHKAQFDKEIIKIRKMPLKTPGYTAYANPKEHIAKLRKWCREVLQQKNPNQRRLQKAINSLPLTQKNIVNEILHLNVLNPSKDTKSSSDISLKRDFGAVSVNEDDSSHSSQKPNKKIRITSEEQRDDLPKTFSKINLTEIKSEINDSNNLEGVKVCVTVLEYILNKSGYEDLIKMIRDKPSGDGLGTVYSYPLEYYTKLQLLLKRALQTVSTYQKKLQTTIDGLSELEKKAVIEILSIEPQIDEARYNPKTEFPEKNDNIESIPSNLTLFNYPEETLSQQPSSFVFSPRLVPASVQDNELFTEILGDYDPLVPENDYISTYNELFSSKEIMALMFEEKSDNQKPVKSLPKSNNKKIVNKTSGSTERNVEKKSIPTSFPEGSLEDGLKETTLNNPCTKKSEFASRVLEYLMHTCGFDTDIQLIRKKKIPNDTRTVYVKPNSHIKQLKDWFKKSLEKGSAEREKLQSAIAKLSLEERKIVHKILHIKPK